MRRAIVSIDFLLTLILLLVATGILISASQPMFHNAAKANAKLKAEALAIGIGSSINHFYAIGAKSGDNLAITVHNPFETTRFPAIADEPLTMDCGIGYDDGMGLIGVGVDYDGDGAADIIAVYPVVDGIDVDPDILMGCNGDLVVTIT
jgi:hypothetical protein